MIIMSRDFFMLPRNQKHTHYFGADSPRWSYLTLWNNYKLMKNKIDSMLETLLFGACESLTPTKISPSNTLYQYKKCIHEP